VYVLRGGADSLRGNGVLNPELPPDVCRGGVRGVELSTRGTLGRT